MSTFTTGIYWQNRQLSLREYADKVKAFLTQIQGIHTAFTQIYWIGNAKNKPVLLSTNLENLNDLIYRFAPDKNNAFDKLNEDGTPSWDSNCPLGFMMRFNTGKSIKDGGIEISISAGISVAKLKNSTTIKFPCTNDNFGNKSEFEQLNFQSRLFRDMILFWEPEYGKIMSIPFEDKFVPDGFTKVGWLTYIKNSNASAMRNNPDLIAAGIEMESVSIGGTLFCIDREMVSPDNETQVTRAKLLRTKLMENHLIES